VPAKSFNCDNFSAFSLHRQRQAAAAGLTVDDHGAGTAHAVLAADMRPGEPAHPPQTISQRNARLYVDLNRIPVHTQSDQHVGCCPVWSRCDASSKARLSNVTASERRYSDGACTSCGGLTALDMASAA